MNYDVNFIRSGIQNEHKRKRFDEGLNQLKIYKEEGELTATEFKDLKYSLMSGIESSWTNLIRQPYYHDGKYQQLPSDLYEIGDLNIGFHLATRSLKKARNYENHPLTRDVIRFLEELAPLGDDVTRLKNNVVKKKKAQVNKEEQQTRKRISQLESKDVRKVRQVLSKITRDIEEDLYNDTVHWLTGFVTRWKKQYDPENRKTFPREYYKHNPFGWNLIERVTRRQGSKINDPYIIKSGYTNTIEQEARTLTTDTVEHFINKNTQKLAEIVSKKQNLKDIKVIRTNFSAGAIEGTLKLSFADGSSFTVDSKVVTSFSSRGLPFHRYPTTFHDVHFSDGSKMKGRASEQRMKSEFVES